MTTTSPDGGVFSITVNGVWCGPSATAVDGLFTPTVVPGAGTVVGYRSGKLACESACASTAAHMCSTEEIVRSAQLGLIPSAGTYFWVAGGYGAYYSPAPGNTRDCIGWTSNAATQLGALVGADSNGPGGGLRIWPDYDYCNRTYKIACCR